MKYYYTVIAFFFVMSIYSQENYVQINGYTNVNTFKCINKTFTTPQNSFTTQLPNLSLKIKDFDCRNKAMTADFQKTLSATEYPFLNIKFLSFKKNNNSYTALIEVRMMGKSRTYQVNFNQENGKYLGERKVKFSSFDIQPPKKMGGMIVVKDDLDLVFAIAANR